MREDEENEHRFTCDNKQCQTNISEFILISSIYVYTKHKSLEDIYFLDNDCIVNLEIASYSIYFQWK